MKKESFVEFKKEHLTGPVPIYNKVGSPIWDLYVLKLISNDGNDAREVRLCTEPNCIDVKTADQKLVKSFFADSLFGEKGLFKENDREDWIFLGKLNEEGKIEENKFKRFFYEVPYSSEPAQIYFDTNYYAVAEKLDAFYASKATNVNNNNSISNTVPAKSNSTIDKQGIDNLFALAREEKKTTPTSATISSNINNEHSNGENKKNNAGSKLFNNKGKTYVMSDIHGMYGSYMDAMEMFTPDDHVIIAGDAIDRGSGGVDILLDIIEKKKDPLNNPKITFLLGNHEHYLFYTINRIINYKMCYKDFLDIMNFKMYARRAGKSPEELSGMKIAHDEAISKIEPEDSKKRADVIDKMLNWYLNDHGETTFDKFIRLPNEQARDIWDLLRNGYAVFPFEENNQKYLVVHAAPPRKDDIESWNEILNMNPIYHKDLYYNYGRDITNTLSFRGNDIYYDDAYSRGFVTICGHTPPDYSEGYAKPEVRASFTRIDGNCGHRKLSSNLIVYNVTDNIYDYIPEKEYKNEIVTSKRK